MQRVERQKHKDRKRRRLTGLLLCAVLLAVSVTVALILNNKAKEEPPKSREKISGAITQRNTEDLQQVTITLRGEKPWTLLQDENGKIYYPNSFLDIARSFGLLYDEISKIMIRKVFERFRDKTDLSVSLNLGIRDIKNKEITELIFDELARSPHPENYVFEILENEDVANYNELVAFVDRVHELGGLISIDDFGSGFSNLQHLLSIHSDFLKIDGSIVVNCCNSKDSENIIALIMGWKKLSSNNIGVVAEFVENDDIQKKLMMYDVDYSQGYLFSKPSPHLEGEKDA